ncbi:hypothetical protein [Lysobacter gummosus]|uniref:hypothetical protein n=1 Tax=Lysobacter gummosus TaxID=262324 RepID=UPI003635C2E6
MSLIHAKASKKRNHIGASPLHEICSQAVKNLGTLGLFTQLKPQQVDSWRKPWEGPSGEGRVGKRVRIEKGVWKGKTGNELWQKIEVLLRSPETQREVVLVLGASLDVDRLYKEARSVSPRPNAIHSLHLLRSTLASTAAAGARLKVFCG